MTDHGPPDAADGNALAPPRAHGVARVSRRPRATPRGGGEYMARPRAGAALPHHHHRRRRYLAAHSPPPTAPFSPVCDTPGAAAAHRHVADAHLHRGAHGRKPSGSRARPSPLAPLARPLSRPSPNPNPRPVLVALTFTLPPPRPHPPALVHAPRRASSSRGVASAPGPSQRRARCPRWARQPRRRLTRSRSTRGPPAVEPQLRAPGAARARRLRRPRRPSCATALL